MKPPPDFVLYLFRTADNTGSGNEQSNNESNQAGQWLCNNSKHPQGNENQTEKGV